jgi:GNAT superfamily N-acetyltransferase
VTVPIQIREYCEGDPIDEISGLLNRGYAALANRGLRYVASWETPDMTASRIPTGTCFLALDDSRIVGTAMLYPPQEDSECDLYTQPGVFCFGKFAVEPERKGQGIGRLLYNAVESAARAQGAEALACDTAEQAVDLIAMYQGWGFQIVGRQDWSLTNYVSVVLVKELDLSRRDGRQGLNTALERL